MPKQDHIYKRRPKTMYIKKINSYGKRNIRFSTQS